MNADDQSTGHTAQFPTVKGTLGVLERREIEYEDLSGDRKEPLLDFLMQLRIAETLGPLGPGIFCVKLFRTMGGNASAVVGIINDLYARGVEFIQSERVQFVMWLAEQEAALDATTFDYICRRLPAPLMAHFRAGSRAMVRDATADGRQSKSA